MSKKTKLMLMLLIAMSVSIIMNCGGAANQPTEETGETQDDVKLGEMLFEGQVKADVNCVSCHDSSTGGAPDLATLVTELSDEEILKAMEQGKGAMPGFGELLLEKEQQQILACLRARFDSGEVKEAETETNSDETSE